MQIVGYSTGSANEPARLAVAESSAVDRYPLEPGEHLDFSLGPRHCAGAVTDDDHRACDAPEAPYCVEHRDTWACARCTGDCTLPLESCREEHAIYLAAFAPDTFKVGVTRSWRLQTRLREQGADRAAHVNTVKNGRIARLVEADIARDLTDRVRAPRKVAGLHRRVDEAAWEALLADYDVRERFAFDYGLELDRQPVHETMARGEIVGTKGRILVLDRADTTYAVDLRNLVGHELTTETDAADDRQSSLASFE